MAAIVILLGAREIAREVITKTETTIGRGDECDVVVANPGVSRVHAIVKSDGRQFFLHDSGSSNGLYHDDHLVRELKLFGGAEVVMGKYTIVFDNEEGLLYPGVFVRVRILGGVIPEAVLVEEAALAIDMGGRYLFVVGEGNVVERRYVTLGQLEGTWRVVESGIETNETYIVDGGIRARPGLPVRPQERDTEASDGSKGE